MNGKRILVAEDEQKIAELLLDYLKAYGFEAEWQADGHGAMASIEKQAPDLVLLDVMLPGLDGMEILKRVRATSQLPIIMVTARVEEIDRLLGLELGADDYICKPFSPREVMARVKSVLRRTGAIETSAPAKKLIDIDEDRHQAKINGKLLNLTPNEFNLLRVFSNNPGRVYSRDHLLEQIYDDFRAVSDRSIDSHIKNLRKKLNAALPERELIRSVYGVGYKLQLEEDD